MFFHIAVAKALISPDRLSNRTDIAYLYYLPFAMAFVSNDKLHKRVVPLLLREDQMFIDGAELKRDLAALNIHYSALPPEVQEHGLFRFAKPPDDDRFLTTRIHRRFGFRLGEDISLAPGQNKRVADDVLAMVEGMRQEAQAPTSAVAWDEAKDTHHISIERKIAPRRGKWRLMSPEAETRARAHEAARGGGGAGTRSRRGEQTP
jgi:hypothetical protein